MSRFTDDVARDLPGIFADAGDPANYQLAGGGSVPLMAVIQKDWEVMDDDQVAMRVTTVCIMARDVSKSRQGDQVITPGRTWTVQQILEDDGHVRRLWVS